MGSPYHQPPQTHGEAIAALVLGVCGIMVLPFFCSIPAIVLGHTARRDIDSSHGRLTGRGMATAGIVLGWVGIVFGIAVYGFFIHALIDTSKPEAGVGFLS